MTGLKSATQSCFVASTILTDPVPSKASIASIQRMQSSYEACRRSECPQGQCSFNERTYQGRQVVNKDKSMGSLKVERPQIVILKGFG